MTMRVQRALVTGAEGFLGRHLVRELQQHGTQVTRLVRQGGTGSATIQVGDAPWSTDVLVQVIRRTEPDVVFHLAGGASGTAEQLQALNVGLATSVLKAIQRAGARPVFVCCGSAAEYGAGAIDGVAVPETALCSPLSPYGVGKLAQTKAALAFGEATGARVLVARIFNPIGPGMPPYPAVGGFAHQIAALPPGGGILRTGNLAGARDFIDVELVTRGFRVLAGNPDARGVVNICSG